MEKHIYFVRHGESNSNADHIIRPPHEMLLTEKGHSQALRVAERVRKLEVEALVSSDYSRALQTAGAIEKATGLPVEPTPLFVEWREASLTMGWNSRSEEARKIYEQMRAGYLLPDHRHSDEENFSDLKQRAFRALAFLEEHPKSRICVVTHGAFLRFLFGAMVFGEDFTGKHFNDLFGNLVTSNTGITYARASDKRTGYYELTTKWEVITWNDLAHFG